MLIPANVSKSAKDYQGAIASSLLSYQYKLNYEYQLAQNTCTTGTPLGYTFISASNLDYFEEEYKYNLLVPETYDVVVIYEGLNTQSLAVGDLLIDSTSFFKVLNPVQSGQAIAVSDVENVTVDIVSAEKSAGNILVPSLNVFYNVANNKTCNLTSRSGLVASQLDFKFNAEKIYNLLPLNTYNLGELEDREVIILNNIVELNDLVLSLANGQRVYLLKENSYFVVLDNLTGEIERDSTGLHLISPTRYLMKGADAGLEYLDTRSQQHFDQDINPLTAQVDSLPYSAQLYGLDGLADDRLLSDRFLGDIDDRNPLSVSEIRTLIQNSLGWCRPNSPFFTRTVKLFDDTRVSKIDFIFDGVNNNQIQVGDRGIIINEDANNTYTAIAPTDSTHLTLENEVTLEEIAVTAGAKLEGVIYSRPTFLNTKGEAMAKFVEALPKQEKDDRFKFTINPADYAEFGLDTITLTEWQNNQRDIELLPGYTYILDTAPITYSISTLNLNFQDSRNAIGDVEAIAGGTKISFTVNPNLDPDVKSRATWVEFGQELRFTVGKLNKAQISADFDPENWLGIVGSKGSNYGISVVNTILGIEEKVPYVTTDQNSLTLVKDDREYQKAEFVRDYIGVHRVQHKYATSDISRSNDYWLSDRDTVRHVLAKDPQNWEQFYLPATDNLVEINKQSGNLVYLNGQNTLLNIANNINSFAINFGKIDNRLAYLNSLGEIYITTHLNPLSPFKFYDNDVKSFNSSHGFYLKSSQVLLNHYLEIYYQGTLVKRIKTEPQTDSNSCQLFNGYPWLKYRANSAASSPPVYNYLNLLTNQFISFGDYSFTKSSPDGRFLLSETASTGLFDTKLTARYLLPQSVLGISPDYRQTSEQDFKYYQVNYNNQIKFLDRDRISTDGINLNLLESTEVETYNFYY